MADKYANFEQLAAAEREGRDFVIRYSRRGSNVLVFGPHAGGIEPGTSEIVLAVADTDLSYYLFEGIKPQGNGELHITSSNFDEPLALEILKVSERAIAFHGEGSDKEVVFLGGRDTELRVHIERALTTAGFVTDIHEDPGLQGVSAKNICNRCISAAGLQLELGKGLRRRFFQSLSFSGRKNQSAELHRFGAAIRNGLRSANAF